MEPAGLDRSGRTDAALLALSALAPACLAALQLANVADAAHDPGVARVLALEPQSWRGLDVLSELVFIALPIGTRAARAAMGGALVAGIAGALLYGVARELLRRSASTATLGPAVATIATLSALLAPSWQRESLIGGSALGGLLAFAPLLCVALSARPAERPEGPLFAWRAAALSLALAVGHEPLVGAVAAAACAGALAVEREARRSIRDAWVLDGRALSAWAMAGALPGLVALAHVRVAGASIGHGVASDGAMAPASRSPVLALAFLRDELGVLLGVLAIGGLVVALLIRRSRSLAVGLLAIVLGGPLCALLGAGAPLSRVSAPLLASFAAACVLAGVAMQAIVRAIAATNVPFARASATMVVVLELALPVDAADETLLFSAPRGDVALWDELAWDALPPRTVVLLTNPRIAARASAARAQGALRDDLVIVPSYATSSSLGRVLSRDGGLVPLWRDLQIEGAPTGASLSALATNRPVAMAYEPGWGKELGRHLVPVALFDVFEPEPRGSSDRRKSLEVFRPKRARLAKLCKGDAELADATATLLRARALELASSGDRDLVGNALDDLRAFAPGDPAATEIVGHVVFGK